MVEDQETIPSMMDGKPVHAARFAATLRRRLFRGVTFSSLSKTDTDANALSLPEHLGLIPPQPATDGHPKVTSYMRPAPHPHHDDGYDEQDLDNLVADPVSDSTIRLWNDTARKNREVFTELFRPVPTNLVRDWSAYEVRDLL